MFLHINVQARSVFATALIAAGASTASAFPVLPPTVYDGLVAYYPFDSNYNDATGRGNNGTASGNITLNAGGVFGSHARDEGGMVNFGQTTDLTFGTGSFTVSFWYRTRNGGALDTIIGNSTIGEGFTGTNTSWQIFQANNGGSIANLVSSGHGPGGRSTAGGPHNNNNGWAFYTMVVDQSAGSVRFYYGNGLFAFGSATAALVPGHYDSGRDLRLGAGMNGIDVDELAFWNRPLSQSDVATLYNGGAGFHLPTPGAAALLSAGGLLVFRRRR